ncbi:unnamed protein product [Brassica oleracea var. botrytis]
MMRPRRKLLTLSFSMLEARLLLPRLLILIPDKDNDLAAAMEYVEDMAFYKEIENESRPQMYMQTHIDINEKMRSILVDWLETLMSSLICLLRRFTSPSA